MGPATAVERRERRLHLLLLLPAALILLGLFLYPLAGVLFRSVYRDGVTLAYYRQVIESPVYLQVILATFQTAGAVTLICLLLGYPLSYVLASLPPRRGRLMLTLVVLPFFTSLIVRTYAWMILLGRNGLVNNSLQALGLVADPLPLLYNQGGVLIGMTYVLLPFMVLTLYSVMRGIDPALLRAAESLGARPSVAFLRIFLPLSLPGVVAGCLLVFIFSLGFFITPALMGGPGDLMIAMLIEREVEFTLNWSLASSLAVVLLVITLAGFALLNRAFRLDRLFEGQA